MVTLTMLRYKKRFIPFAFLAMAVHRIALSVNKNIIFWKLMGSGKNGTFDKIPDLQQWAILAIHRASFSAEKSDRNTYLNKLYNPFIARWLRFFNVETLTYYLEPIEGHGLWDGKAVFGNLPQKSDFEGQIAVLTRATIRISKLNAFWKNVDGVASQMAKADGLIVSYGIGEIPWIKQATLSIWENREAMKNFAYKMQQHSEVIRKTRLEKWYAEDMFIRFKILNSIGTLNKTNPLSPVKN